jgi:hypothetical protein
MGSRGRKSASELSTVGPGGIALVRRPEPSEHLDEDATTIWQATVNSLPADWFSPGALPMLEALCVLAVSQRYTLRALQKIERGRDDFDHDDWQRVQKQLGEISARISALATKLRLTPQSKYGARAAATAAGRGSARKLWEFDGSEPWLE